VADRITEPKRLTAPRTVSHRIRGAIHGRRFLAAKRSAAFLRPTVYNCNLVPVDSWKLSNYDAGAVQGLGRGQGALRPGRT
jgi:hypothetical protein